MSDTASPCFDRIGTWGDRSCPLLVQHVHCRNCETYASIGRSLLEQPAPAGYLGEWRERVARKDSATAREELRSLTVFRLGSEWLALPTAAVREVADPMPIRRLPHRDDPRLRGLVNLRGEVLPCVDLARLLGSAPPAGKQDRAWERMLVIEREGAAWAFLVDEVEGIRRVTGGQLRRPPATVEEGAAGFTEFVFSGSRGDVGLLEEALVFHGLKEVCR